MKRFIFVLIGSVSVLFSPLWVTAATIDVNTDKDEYTKDGDCALREAIQAANKNMALDACPAGDDNNDTINLPAGIYKIEIAPDGTPDDGEDGDFDVSASLTIQGSGIVVIDGNQLDRVFHISSGNFTLSQVTIQNGKTIVGNGGGIYRSGANDGLLKIVQSAIVNNQSVYGGGVFTKASLEMINSTISGNQAKGTGGLFLEAAGGNYSLNNVTIAFNKALGPGWVGGVYVSIGALKVANSIIALNEDPTVKGPDCDESVGTHESLGYNIIGNTKGCNRTGQVDKDILNPVNFQLAPLAYNGGTTLNHALQTGSAIDGGNPSGCADANGNPLNADQRGVNRYGVCDIGAFEFGFCGDGFLQTTAGEACDDGNQDNGDGCSASCVTEQPVPTPTPSPTPNPEPATTPVQDPTDDPSSDDPAVEPVSEQPEQGPASDDAAGGGCSLATAPHAGHSGTVIGFLLLTIPLILGGKWSNFFEV